MECIVCYSKISFKSKRFLQTKDFYIPLKNCIKPTVLSFPVSSTGQALRKQESSIIKYYSAYRLRGNDKGGRE